MYLVIKFIVKYFLLSFAVVTAYYVGASRGYDLGFKDKSNNDILTNDGRVVCHYVGKKCNAEKRSCQTSTH